MMACFYTRRVQPEDKSVRASLGKLSAFPGSWVQQIAEEGTLAGVVLRKERTAGLCKGLGKSGLQKASDQGGSSVEKEPLDGLKRAMGP